MDDMIWIACGVRMIVVVLHAGAAMPNTTHVVQRMHNTAFTTERTSIEADNRAAGDWRTCIAHTRSCVLRLLAPM